MNASANATSEPPPDQPDRIFLCHNNLDKAAVQIVADSLELDFGIAHFLDIYAIPTGEAFIPWIEAALADSSGCAIFLGGNGWGPTHLLEAELALARHRRDLDFRLVPVALPGFSPDEAAKLGSGTFFREVNWANLSGGIDDPDALEKLRAALTGQALVGDRGPAKLTPYQIRRDAARWIKSDKKDRSLLYRGAQLTEAQRLSEANPDIVGTADVAAFLVAAARVQQQYWRRLAGAALVAMAVILAAALAAYLQYRLAEERRLQSVSRQLAMLARDADGVDRALLLSVQAYRTSPTPEAVRSLFEETSKWRDLERMLYVDTSVEALAVTPGGTLVAGTADGEVRLWRLSTGESAGELGDKSHHGKITALHVDKAERLWIGREDGTIDIWNGLKAPEAALDPVRTTEPVPRRDRRILTIAEAPRSGLVATGSASGEVVIFDAESRTPMAVVQEDPMTRITSLAFDRSGERLIAGTQMERLLVIDARKGAVLETFPRLDGGVVKVAVSSDDDRVGVLTGYGMVHVLEPSADGGFTRSSSSNVPSFISAADFDPSRGWLALGDADGNIHLRDLYGEEAGFVSLRPHRAVVRAVAFAPSGELVTAAGDGTIAVWSLTGPVEPVVPLPPLPLDPSTIRVLPDQRLVAAGTMTGTSGIWREGAGGGWERVADLIADTGRIDQTLLEPVSADLIEPGFVEIGDAEIPQVELDQTGSTAVWTTRGGGVLWRAGSPDEPGEDMLLDRLDEQPATLAVSANGRIAAAAVVDRAKLYPLGKQGATIDIPVEANVRSLAFDPAGETLAAGLEDGRVAVYRTSDGAHRFTTDAIGDSPIGGLLFTADGRRLFTYGVTDADRGIAQIPIDHPSDIRRLRLQLAGGAPSSIAIGDQAGYLAVGDQQGRVLLWRLPDLAFVTALSAGGLYVSALAFAEDADRLVTASSDRGLLDWQLDPTALSGIACEKVGREFDGAEWREVLSDDPQGATCGLQ